MLVNCGIFTDSIAYIRRAARLKEQYPRLSSTTYVSVLMASHEMRYGDPRRALPLARKAKAESDSTRNLLNQIYTLVYCPESTTGSDTATAPCSITGSMCWPKTASTWNRSATS